MVGGASVDPDPTSMLIYKLLQLNCLAVYWQSSDSLLGISPPDDWTVGVAIVCVGVAIVCVGVAIVCVGVAIVCMVGVSEASCSAVGDSEERYRKT